MKNLLLCLLVLFGFQTLSAQMSLREVFPNGAGNVVNDIGIISFTIGQSTVQTIQNGNVTLTQGFQQPDSRMSVGTIDFLPESAYKIFPNPNRGAFSLELNASDEISGQVRITSILGHLIEKRELKPNVYHLEDFELVNVQSGMYVMTLISSDQKTLLTKLITVQP